MPADQAATEFGDGLVNVSTALETNTEAREVMQPGMRAFNNPPIFGTGAAMFGAMLAMPLGVVAAIGVDHARVLQWMAAQSPSRRSRVDQRRQLLTSLTFAPVGIAASGVP